MTVLADGARRRITPRPLLTLHLDARRVAGVERPAEELRALADVHRSPRRTAIGA